MNAFLNTNLRTTSGLNAAQHWHWNVYVTRSGAVVRNRQGYTRTFLGGLLRLCLAAVGSLRELSRLPGPDSGSSAAGSAPPG